MPQRLLRPGLTTSRRFNRCGWFAQSLYVRLLTQVDDHGRLEADPELLRAGCFPYGDPEGKEIPLRAIDGGLLALADKCLLNLYEIKDMDGSKRYLQLQKWKERIRSPSKYPAAPSTTQQAKEPDKMLSNACNCQGQQLSAGVCQLTTDDSLPARVEGVGVGEGVVQVREGSPEGGEGATTPADSQLTPGVEPPPGFPATPFEVIPHAAFVGCDAEFAVKIWNKAKGRGYRDSRDVPVRIFRNYLATEWTYERERLEKDKTRGTPGDSSNMSILDMKTLLAAKKEHRETLRNQHAYLEPGNKWAWGNVEGPEVTAGKKSAYREVGKLNGEIKALSAKLAGA